MRGQDRFRLRRRGLAPALALALAVCAAAPLVLAQTTPSEVPPGELGAPLRGGVPFDATSPADPLARYVADDVRRMRAYPDQPPVIPHSIEGYQLSVNANRCLSCHRREFTEGSGAPMISVTHYITREGQMLADVSPRRYFCTACHVPQAAARPPVANTFRDMSEMPVDHAGGAH